jgi:two-component system NtrC family response regulator
MITAAPEMLKVSRTIERVANAACVRDAARRQRHRQGTARPRLHRRSARRRTELRGDQLRRDPENLLEAELFGYEKGAFTGAVKTTEGKIELAGGGTLFLDEVGDIPLPLQVKLLRFLQERTIERIGGRKPIAVDTRIVCATHQDLAAMIKAGSFREDLWYRLAEIVVRIPSLAERPGDAALLAKHFLHRFAAEMNPAVKGFTPAALAAIDAWPWPGNVRELENRMKRAVIMADGKMLTPEDLDLGDSEGDALPINLKAVREAADRRAIRQALARTEGNISSTARLLGISRPTLYDLLERYGLQP